MEPNKPELDKYEKHYIITDGEHFITNITDGLCAEIGLHPKFFEYTDSIF